jgi:hypothetical protein
MEAVAEANLFMVTAGIPMKKTSDEGANLTFDDDVENEGRKMIERGGGANGEGF